MGTERRALGGPREKGWPGGGGALEEGQRVQLHWPGSRRELDEGSEWTRLSGGGGLAPSPSDGRKSGSACGEPLMVGCGSSDLLLVFARPANQD